MADLLPVTSSLSCERVLGISFFNGTAVDAVRHHCESGGYLVAPAAPALLKLKHDPEYRRAMENADRAIADSGLLAFLWKMATGRRLESISGIAYLKALLERLRRDPAETSYWIVGSNDARKRALEWVRGEGIAVEDRDCFVAQAPASSAEDYAALIAIEDRRPKHIIIAAPRGTQEKLALYLRDYLLYRPAIHCVGAALGFLSGDERPIPEWALRSHLGWLVRMVSQPKMVLPRIGIAFALARMVFKDKSELPPLKPRWADV